jgi:hypothetical protein
MSLLTVPLSASLTPALARQAQISPADDRSVLARFWDRIMPSPPIELTVVVDQVLVRKINSFAKESDEELNNRARARDILLAVFDEIKKERKFQPEFHIVLDFFDASGYEYIGKHPNSLYSMYASPAMYGRLKDNVGLYLTEQNYPKSEQADDANDIMFGNKDPSHDYTTLSEVNYDGVQANKKHPRTPSQIQVMRKSPNDVRPLSKVILATDLLVL